MKKTYNILFALLFTGILFVTNDVSAQEKKLVTIESVIIDENGNPIQNAEVYSNSVYSKTDAEGRFSVQIEPDSRLIIESKGYIDISLTPDEAKSLARITLKATDDLFDREGKVDLAFRKAYKGDVVGFVSSVSSKSVDDVDNTIWLNDVLSGRALGLLGNSSIRGIGIGINVADITGSGLNTGNALFVVDGLPRSIDNMRLSEVENITILRDVNAAALYGSAAVNGVVLITTKRGQAFKKRSDFSLNYGISTPRALPAYLNSADYMDQFNKARISDGLTPLYPDSVVQNFRNGNPYRYPSVDYYSDNYMNSFKDYFDLMGEFSGGNDVASFYSNISWNSSGSILDFGEAANARNNIFNLRANVDLKINNWIKTAIDGASTFGNNRSQRGGFWSGASSRRPFEFTPLLPFDLIDPENSLLVNRKNDVDGKYLLGGNASFLTNPIADSYSGGVVENIERRFSFNNRIDFDLNKITEGLSFHTNISFDFFTIYDQTVANQYSVYEPVWAANEDKIVDLKQHGLDASSGTQAVGNTDFNRRFGFYGMFGYDRIFNDAHHVTGSLVGYGSFLKEQNDPSNSYDEYQGVKHSHMGLQLGYNYKRKYMVDFSSAYVNSVKLAEGNRGGFSPSLGVSWILSSEDFLSSAKNIDLLKIRLSGGMLNSDLPIIGFFYYDNRYTTSGSYAWNDGARSRSGVMSSWNNNPNLGYAKRNEFNFGIEGSFFDKMLGAELNLFYDVYSDLVTRPTTSYPSFYNDFIPYENYEADEYKGVELGLNFDKTVGNWNFFAGATMLYVTSTSTKVNEVYSNDYQYRQGRPVDATFGLEAIGFFKDQADIDNSPLQSFGSVAPGDIKYKDQNGDGIVDSNDEVYLRRYQAPLSGGLQLKISYKNLTLYALGEGRSGSENFKENSYYWIDANDKYSEEVLNAWTPETHNTATYPRVSSQANSNNLRRSSFWLYNNDYFNVRKVQLTWNLPGGIAKALLMNKLDVFVNASELFQLAKNKDIRDLRVGSEPYYRTYSIGVKANF